VKKNGKGWQDYKFVNPVTKQIEPKAMYFEQYEDVVVNCGIYK
jgi:cytochrome c